MEINLIELSSLIAAVVGIVQVLKKSFDMKTKYAPLASLVLGIASAFLFPQDVGIGITIYTGIIIGLSSSGLYSGAKTSAVAMVDSTD